MSAKRLIRGRNMRKIALAACTTFIAQAALLTTPAMAATTVDGIIPTAADLTASCQTYLHADVNGGFMAVAINANRVDTLVSSTESEHVTTYSGEPTKGGIEMLSLSKNSGADMQIFGDKFYTTQTFPSGLETWTTTTVTESHFVYDCKIYKMTKNGKEVIPSDKQRPGQISSSWTTTVTEDHERAIASVTVALSPPEFVDRAPVCRLDKIKVGTGRDATFKLEWNAKNGYDGSLGECSGDLYDDVPVFGGN
mgnify:CR=1 FL=1